MARAVSGRLGARLSDKDSLRPTATALFDPDRIKVIAPRTSEMLIEIEPRIVVALAGDSGKARDIGFLRQTNGLSLFADYRRLKATLERDTLTGHQKTILLSQPHCAVISGTNQQIETSDPLCLGPFQGRLHFLRLQTPLNDTSDADAKEFTIPTKVFTQRLVHQFPVC
jgi:hypothetical protein